MTNPEEVTMPDAYDRLTAARGDIRRAAARCKRALAVLYPVGTVVEFRYIGKRTGTGTVGKYLFNSRTGAPELFIDMPSGIEGHRFFVRVCISSVLRVVTPGGTPCPAI